MLIKNKPVFGRYYYRPKSSTCAICKTPVIKISKIHIKGPKYVYHCERCKKAAEELAEVLKEDYGVI